LIEIEKFEIDGLLVLTPKCFQDSRGFFTESYNKRTFDSVTGLSVDFVQDNFSKSVTKNTIRGLHFQNPPAAQDKLVQVVKGSIFDVAVDLRKTSPTLGKFVSIELSAENRKQFYIPKGFAHGFCTLEENVEVMYKVTDFYAPDVDGCVLWNDDAFNIPWPLGGQEAHLSEKDSVAPRLKDIKNCF
jgi:dTDP-4-dehydrorhamnose 3,5-epimerase